MGSGPSHAVEHAVELVLDEAFILPTTCKELARGRRDAVLRTLHAASAGLWIGLPEDEIVDRCLADVRGKLAGAKGLGLMQAETLMAESVRTVRVACKVARVRLSQRIIVAMP